MPDIVTSTSKIGFGKRLMNSIGGILIGFVLFIGAFAVLWNNEGRVDLSNIAENAVAISSTKLTDSVDSKGNLVSSEGIISSDQLIGDGLYLAPGEFLAIKRTVEVYAWVQNQTTETKEHIGGSQTSETTYTYTKDWTNSPAKTSSFHSPEGHENPSKPLDDFSDRVSSAKLGVYTLDAGSLDLPGFEPVSLNEDNTTISEESTAELIGSTYIFNGLGSASEPEVGDVRISYEVVPSNQEVTVFGVLDGTRISTFVDKDNNKLYRAFSSNAGEALVTLHGEYKFQLWLWRVIGFLMMWIGLSMIFAPIGVLASVIPFLGHLTGAAVRMVTFIVSLIASILTIIVAMIAQNLLALIIVALFTAGAVYLFLLRKDKMQNASEKPMA